MSNNEYQISKEDPIDKFSVLSTTYCVKIFEKTNPISKNCIRAQGGMKKQSQFEQENTEYRRKNEQTKPIDSFCVLCTAYCVKIFEKTNPIGKGHKCTRA